MHVRITVSLPCFAQNVKPIGWMKHMFWTNEISRDLSLTHWGRVAHICVSEITIIGSDNGLSPGRRQAIIWTNAGILLIGVLETNFSEILVEIITFSFKKMRLKVSSAKWRPCCLGLNMLRWISDGYPILHRAPGLYEVPHKIQSFISFIDQTSSTYGTAALCMYSKGKRPTKMCHIILTESTLYSLTIKSIWYSVNHSNVWISINFRQKRRNNVHFSTNLIAMI